MKTVVAGVVGEMDGAAGLEAHRRELGGPRWDLGVALALGAVIWLTRNAAPWVVMWSLAGWVFLTLKLATLRGCTRDANRWLVLAYIALWPGMNAASFLRGGSRDRAVRPGSNEKATRDGTRPAGGELAAAGLKLGIGLAMAGWTIANVADPRVVLVAWTGMLGLVLTLHFGVLHLVSWIWRRIGFAAPPIMRAPLAATSLAELWGERWNTAFSDVARRFILRPLGRRLGARRAGWIVFLASGLIHDLVISVPAGGGWGGPTLYFLLQAAGVVAEKSRGGRRVGLGRGVRGWLWTFLVALAPLPLLFHGPFARNVIVPFFATLANLILP